MCYGVRDLTAADDRSNRVRREHKNESVDAFDSAIDGLHEILSRTNVLPVHPRLSPPTFQCLIQTTHKVLVFA